MKYRKKPVVVEAMQYDGSDESGATIAGWVGVAAVAYKGKVSIRTLEGTMEAVSHPMTERERASANDVAVKLGHIFYAKSERPPHLVFIEVVRAALEAHAAAAAKDMQKRCLVECSRQLRGDGTIHRPDDDAVIRCIAAIMGVNP